ncbi:hypothetical protein VE00_08303 [Pseudogymnoascus sp. WSF 3629]|nr:hypothetical protein VE00_08303 [Pseudogymnoascus sp. WSF 3629]
MASSIHTRQWVLQNRPTTTPMLDGPNATFKLVNTRLEPLRSSQVLLKAKYFSNDAAQRVWINASKDTGRLYVKPVEIGEVMRCSAIAEVIESRSTKFPKGSLVKTMNGWSEFTVQDEDKCTALLDTPGINVTHQLGALGIGGLTAYYGLVDVAKTSKRDTVVVSGAAGATGSMAVQVAKKIIGCEKVIGIAGTDEKCRWVEKLGADKCLNYKSESFEQDLANATEGYVDVFFDNVAGNILDLMLTRMKMHGRIAQCGAVAMYNKLSEAMSLKNYGQLISNRLSVLGFIAFDYLEMAPQVYQLLTDAVNEGRLEVDDANETMMVAEFENIPKIWMMLYDGGNTGKLVTKLE